MNAPKTPITADQVTVLEYGGDTVFYRVDYPCGGAEYALCYDENDILAEMGTVEVITDRFNSVEGHSTRCYSRQPTADDIGADDLLSYIAHNHGSADRLDPR
jgi:hypothetical protein